MRAIARELGGSVTLVTHYFPTRRSILECLAPQLFKRWQAEVDATQDAAADETERLRALLFWILPLDRTDRIDDRAFHSLLGASPDDRESIGSLFRDFDEWIRRILRAHLASFVSADRLNQAVELIRVSSVGIELLSLESPDAWPRERQVAILGQLLRLIGLPDVVNRPGFSGGSVV